MQQTHKVIDKDAGASMYCFEAGHIIGINGFSFHKHTFINLNGNIHHFSFELLGE
ncbi:hypothetical protein [Dysgonomonas termitidis]|uniref:Uncharacterized protein n=1 Tax=Dysgonomonas termitidis TaxID=1516126 RepID=A0ABV9L281_9BACT